MFINRPTVTAPPYRREDLIRYGHLLANTIGERPDFPVAPERSGQAERMGPNTERMPIES